MTEPVIVVSGSTLTLYRGGQPEDKPVVIPKIYHELKAIAHLPFTLYLALAPEVGSERTLPADLTALLESLSRHVVATREALAETGLSPVQLARQRVVLRDSLDLVAQVTTSKRVESWRLREYAAKMGPLLLLNASEAGCAQIRSTHAQVMAWRRTMSADEFRRLRVTVRGKHQARYRNAATQYFAWLLGDKGSSWSYPGESLRVVFVEYLAKAGNIADKDEDSRDVLSTVILDSDASAAFFGDKWRLSVDILADGAGDCIREIERPIAGNGALSQHLRAK